MHMTLKAHSHHLNNVIYSTISLQFKLEIVCEITFSSCLIVIGSYHVSYYISIIYLTTYVKGAVSGYFDKKV